MDDAERLELAQSMIVGLGFGDAACAVEDLAVVQVKEGVEARGPVLHSHRDLTTGSGLGQVEEGIDQAAEVFEFITGEVVLADGDITWQDLAVGAVRPAGQAHVGLTSSGTGLDELGGGVAVDSVVELVLDGGKEPFGGGGVLVVVDAGGVDVGEIVYIHHSNSSTHFQGTSERPCHCGNTSSRSEQRRMDSTSPPDESCVPSSA